MNTAKNDGKKYLVLLTTTFMAFMTLFVYVIPVKLWDHLAPMSWKQHWEAAEDSFSLAVLFVGLPALLGGLAAFGMICWALVLSRFVPRPAIESYILSLSPGSQIGAVEKRVLDFAFRRVK